MKKIFLMTPFVFSCMLAYDYEGVAPSFDIYTSCSKTISMQNITNKEELFFGTKEQYIKTEQFNGSVVAGSTINGLADGVKSGANAFAKGLTNEGLKHGVAGLGIGLIFGLIDGAIKADKEKKLKEKVTSLMEIPFFLVERITNSKGETTIKRTMATSPLYTYSNFKADEQTLASIKKRILEDSL